MRWIIVGAAVAALALALVGCGGSSDSSSDATTDTVVTDTSASTEQTSTAETSTEQTSSDETPTGTDALAGLSGECSNLAEASQAFGAAIASSAGGNDDLDATADAYKAFAEKAPAELKDDFEVIAGLMGEYATALRDLDLKAGETPSPAQIAKLAVLAQSLSTADAQKASVEIATWMQKNCGSTP